MIGTGFMWVIRLEYLVGAYVWKRIAAFGVAVCLLALVMPSFLVSAVVGIIGGSIVWGAMEMPHQEERVDHGLFRAHPNRASRPRANSGEHEHSHGSKPGLGKWWSF